MHLHTCLSPCAGYDVTPAAVVKRAADLGLDLIAVTDHNSVENAPAALEAAARLGERAPRVLAGLEVTSAEEAHLLALFERLADALTFQAMVYDHLQEGVNDPELFGDQVAANADDEVEYFNTRLLMGATDLAVEELAARIHALDGLALACHVDRPSFSVVSQLGMLPPDLDLDGVEVSPRADPRQASRWIGDSPLAVTTSSDAHHLDQVGEVWTELALAAASLEELRLGLKGLGGRRVLGWGRRKEGADAQRG
jgi:PHP family Zn ribbon phosphoesterase